MLCSLRSWPWGCRWYLAFSLPSSPPLHPPPRCGPTGRSTLPNTHCRLCREFGAGTCEHCSVLRFSRAALTSQTFLPHSCFPGAGTGDDVCSARLHTGHGAPQGKPRPLYRAVLRAMEAPRAVAHSQLVWISITQLGSVHLRWVKMMATWKH